MSFIGVVVGEKKRLEEALRVGTRLVGRVHCSKLSRGLKGKLKRELSEIFKEALCICVKINFYEAVKRFSGRRRSRGRGRSIVWRCFVNHLVQLVESRRCSREEVREVHLDVELAGASSFLASFFPRAKVIVRGELFQLADIIANSNVSDREWVRKVGVLETKLRV